MTSVQHDQKGQEGQEEQEPDRQRSTPHRVKGAHIITERIEVGVPVERAYEQWTQYDHWHEMFKKESAHPAKGQESGQQDESEEQDESEQGDSEERDGKGDTDQGQVTVEAKIGPSRRQWRAEITEEDPPHRLSWRATGGVQAHGTTTFHRLSDRLTKVMVEIEYRPSGLVETVGNFFRMQRRRVRRDLRLFKNHVELRSADRDGRNG